MAPTSPIISPQLHPSAPLTHTTGQLILEATVWLLERACLCGAACPLPRTQPAGLQEEAGAGACLHPSPQSQSPSQTRPSQGMHFTFLENPILPRLCTSSFTGMSDPLQQISVLFHLLAQIVCEHARRHTERKWHGEFPL